MCLNGGMLCTDTAALQLCHLQRNEVPSQPPLRGSWPEPEAYMDWRAYTPVDEPRVPESSLQDVSQLGAAQRLEAAQDEATGPPLHIPLP